MATPRYAPYVGGVQRHVQELARRVAAAGCEVTVLTTDVSGNLPREERLEDVSVMRVRAWPRNRDYYFAPEVARVVAHGDWDVLHVQSYHTFVAPLAMLAAVRRNLPFVVTFHGGGHSSKLRSALGRLKESMGDGPHDRLIIYVSSHSSDGTLHLAGTELPLQELVD